MSGSYDDSVGVEVSSDSFWEVTWINILILFFTLTIENLIFVHCELWRELQYKMPLVIVICRNSLQNGNEHLGFVPVLSRFFTCHKLEDHPFGSEMQFRIEPLSVFIAEKGCGWVTFKITKGTE